MNIIDLQKLVYDFILSIIKYFTDICCKKKEKIKQEIKEEIQLEQQDEIDYDNRNRRNSRRSYRKNHRTIYTFKKRKLKYFYNI